MKAPASRENVSPRAEKNGSRDAKKMTAPTQKKNESRLGWVCPVPRV
jgi:hypothetical protein